MKLKSAILTAIFVSGIYVSAQTSPTASDATLLIHNQIGSNPNVFENTIGIPDTVPYKVYEPATMSGKVETFYYDTTDSDGNTVKKRAQVYTPHCYKADDRTTRYNVLYLMHGGGDNSTSFFADPRNPLSLVNVLDHLIEDGLLEPLIVVTPTFYPDDLNIGANRMQDAIAMTRDFHKELRSDLIPSVETAYNTWLEKPDSRSVTDSRRHRAFGGFSMGALATWYQLAYDNDAVAHYLPLSGDLWTFDSDGNRQTYEASACWLEDMLKKSDFANEFQVYAYTGTEDIAGEPEKNLIQALLTKTSLFRNGGKNANLRFYMKPGGQHWYGDINAYLYQALPSIKFGD